MSERNYEDECGDHGGRTTDGEPCGLPAGWGTENDSGRCKHCLGTSPDGSSHKNNKHALKHGFTADPMGLFEWLAENDPGAAAYIVGKLWDYSERAPQPVFEIDVTPDTVDDFGDVTAHLTAYGDDLLTTCVRDYARKRAEHIQLTEGIITEQQRASENGAITVEDSNPVNIDLDRFDRNQLRRKDKLGVLPDDGADVEVEVTSAMWENLTNYYDE